MLKGVMWDWFLSYPSYRAEQVATPCGKGWEKAAPFDYIIVGGTSVAG